MGTLRHHFAGKHIHFHQLFHLVVEHFDADCLFPVAGGDHFDHIPPDSEGTPVEIDVVAGVLVFHQFAENGIAVDNLPNPQGYYGVVIILGAA